MQSIGIFVTKLAHNEYKKETFPFQKIRCLVNVRDLKNASFYLTFNFCDPEDKNIIFSEGYQQIVFADSNHRPTRLPADVIQKISEYIL